MYLGLKLLSEAVTLDGPDLFNILKRLQQLVHDILQATASDKETVF